MKSQDLQQDLSKVTRLLAKYIRPSLGKKRLWRSGRWTSKQSTSTCQIATFRRERSKGLEWVLNAAFRQALQWEMILEVPTKGAKLPRIRRREMSLQCRGDQNFSESCATDDVRDFV